MIPIANTVTHSARVTKNAQQFHFLKYNQLTKQSQEFPRYSYQNKKDQESDQCCLFDRQNR